MIGLLIIVLVEQRRCLNRFRAHMLKLALALGTLIVGWHLGVLAIKNSVGFPEKKPFIHYLVNCAFCLIIFVSVYYRTHVQMKRRLVEKLDNGS